MELIIVEGSLVCDCEFYLLKDAYRMILRYVASKNDLKCEGVRSYCPDVQQIHKILSYKGILFVQSIFFRVHDESFDYYVAVDDDLYENAIE